MDVHSLLRGNERDGEGHLVHEFGFVQDLCDEGRRTEDGGKDYEEGGGGTRRRDEGGGTREEGGGRTEDGGARSEERGARSEERGRRREGWQGFSRIFAHFARILQ